MATAELNNLLKLTTEELQSALDFMNTAKELKEKNVDCSVERNIRLLPHISRKVAETLLAELPSRDGGREHASLL